MILPHLNQKDFISLLTSNGYKVVSKEYLEKFNRIIVEKNGYSFPIQVNKISYFPLVVKTCKMLGITPPPDHLLCYNQLKGKFGKV